MARRETPGASSISLVPAVEIKAILYRRYSRNSLTQLPAFFLQGGEANLHPPFSAFRTPRDTIPDTAKSFELKSDNFFFLF